MGKGDQKTRRGKLFSGSYGVLRPRRKRKKLRATASTVKKQAAPKPAKTEPEKPKPVKSEAPKTKTAKPAKPNTEEA